MQKKEKLRFGQPPAAQFDANITNSMADGSVRNSVEGYEVPVNQYTGVCYELLAKFSEIPAKNPDKNK